MKTFRFVINVPFILFILYGTIMNFAIYDNDCENFVSGILRAFNFLRELFFISFIITFCFNILNERKIEKENFAKRILKISLLHIIIFVFIFVICVINEMKYCNLI